MNVARRMLKVVGALLMTGALLLATACSALKSNSDGKPRVVAEIYPFQFVAEHVGGDLISIETLTPPGVSAHGYELAPVQVASVQDADVVIYQAGFQVATDDAVKNSGVDNALEVGSYVELIPYETKDRGYSGGNNIFDYDTHTWLDPENMSVVGQELAKRLGEIDPENKDKYQENADQFTTELKERDKQWAKQLASCERREFIPSHTAFGYFAKRYDLVQIPIAGLVPDQEPSPARIAEIQEMVKEYGITTIFYETLVSPALSNMLADDLGLETDVLDPVAGLTDQSKGNDYFEIMDANVDSIAKANGCK